MAYLKSEIGEYFDGNNTDIVVDTIYFGGGTPSVLSLEEVSDILSVFPPRAEDYEISFECNPEDITIEYVVGLFGLGINRLSVGVQTLNNISLKEIHRSDENTILSALEAIENAIIITQNTPSINVDFILGLPYVEPGETLRDIQELHRKYRCITHTSLYILEKGLYPKGWKSHTIDDGDIQTEFLDAIEYFDSLGWYHYEFSNWSRPNYECRHNQSYWNHSEYRGFGLSAANYIAGERYMNSESFAGYYEGKKIDSEHIGDIERQLEELMFGLRTNGYHNRGYISEKNIKNLIGTGHITYRDNIIHLTKTGIFLIDHIIGELIA